MLTWHLSKVESASNQRGRQHRRESDAYLGQLSLCKAHKQTAAIYTYHYLSRIDGSLVMAFQVMRCNTRCIKIVSAVVSCSAFTVKITCTGKEDSNSHMLVSAITGTKSDQCLYTCLW